MWILDLLGTLSCATKDVLGYLCLLKFKIEADLALTLQETGVGVPPLPGVMLGLILGSCCLQLFSQSSEPDSRSASLCLEH